MYKTRGVPRKFIDPARQAELQERDRIRQEYYAKLEKEKQEKLAPADPVVESVKTDELQNGDVVLKKEIKIKERKPLPEPKPLKGIKRKKKG